MKIVWILLGIIGIVAIYTNLAPQAEMSIQNFQTSVTTLAYAGEFVEIKKSVDEFLVLKSSIGTEDAEPLANKIDQRVNKLGLVKNYCKEEISTLELANSKYPYEELQQICPALKNISLGKAIELFRLI